MLLDKYLPVFTYHEIHKTLVKASAKDCFAAAKDLDMSASRIAKFLLRLRGLPAQDLTLRGFIKNACFVYIEEEPYKEFVIDASQSGLKIFWNFYFDPVSINKTVVSTETRILCLNQKVKFRFSIYWFLIKPFSGLIRRELLRLIKKRTSTTIAHPNTV